MPREGSDPLHFTLLRFTERDLCGRSAGGGLTWLQRSSVSVIALYFPATLTETKSQGVGLIQDGVASWFYVTLASGPGPVVPCE